MDSDEHPSDEVRAETDGANAESPGAHDETLPRLLAAISEQVGEIREQLERLLNVQFDRIRLRARSGLFWMLMALLFGAVGVVATVAAVLYVLEGVSGLFTALFSGNVWAGDLAAGGLTLLTILLVAVIFAGGFRKKELERLKKKYESNTTDGEAQ